MSEQRPSGPPRPTPNPRPTNPPAPAENLDEGVESAPPKKSKGALIGWLVSAVMVVGVAVALMAALGIFKGGKDKPFGDPTADTTAGGVLDVVGVSIDVGAVTTPPPSAPSSGMGAVETYQKLVKASYPMTNSYKPGEEVTDKRLMSAWEKIESLFRKKHPSDPPPQWIPEYDPIVALILKGADEGYNETYDLVFPDCPVNFKNENAFADLIRSWAKLLEYKSLDADADKKFAEGEKYLRASLIFGERLWKYGVYVGPRKTGLQIANQALSGLEGHYKKSGDAAKEAAAKAARVPVSEAVKKWNVKFDTLFMPMQFQAVGKRKSAAGIEKSALETAADIWNVAENDKDRSWRLSAVMWFGYLKAANGVNEGKVNDYLEARAKKERDKKGDITLADRADDAAKFKMEEANDMIRPMTWAQD